jgi:transcription antitermination factor NusG
MFFSAQIELYETQTIEMKWYVAYTKPDHEKKVSKILTQKNVVNFCPFTKVSTPAGTKIYEQILFTNCVFIRSSENELEVLKRTRGIINFVHWMQKPAVIDDFEIDLIKRFVETYVNVKVKKTGMDFSHSFNSHHERSAKLVHLKNDRVSAALPSLGHIMFVEKDESVLYLENTTSPIEKHYKYAQ